MWGKAAGSLSPVFWDRPLPPPRGGSRQPFDDKTDWRINKYFCTTAGLGNLSRTFLSGILGPPSPCTLRRGGHPLERASPGRESATCGAGSLRPGAVGGAVKRIEGSDSLEGFGGPLRNDTPSVGQTPRIRRSGWWADGEVVCHWLVSRLMDKSESANGPNQTCLVFRVF